MTDPRPARGAAPGAAAPGPTAPGAAAAPPGRARRLAAPALTAAAVAGAFAYVGLVDPNEPGHYPVCPMFRLTGILCPGCGGLRSAHAFAHGDPVTALGDNALAVTAYVAFAGYLVLWLVRAAQGRPAPRPALRPWHWWVLGGAALAFTVVRNLPVGSALAP
ncbi:DUF2752 domain-containing protein [Streptomyces antimicrobicus]|uniref:DUF2752 domain-containing protein n=1 Tax=Streptomyces antimicrobicus TaxID=2883108 RepID=A0ABS8B420_9ACTN|nr:DUF2752 domain-containing protein [Streptomyces antimicrobicus]MCB5179327.1 DUF2752 domain-containing protein [Streptomyces antimicrobicus]